MEFVAEFPKAEDAKNFAARITEPGWSAENVVLKGRKVTWTRPTGGIEYLMDMMETVGYYGSTQARKAKLNGRPCPMSY